MKRPIRIVGYLIPDASMLADRAQWITLSSVPATVGEAEALKRAIKLVQKWRKLLETGSHQGVVRVMALSARGVPFFDAHAPNHEEAGDYRTRPAQHGGVPAFATAEEEPRTAAAFAVGDVITRVNPENPEARIVEEVQAIYPVDAVTYKYHLHALYLSKRYASDQILEDVLDYRIATKEDVGLAQAYAVSFADHDPDSDSSGSAGGKPASRSGSKTTSGARSQPGSRRSSQTSNVATLETQNGSQRALTSQQNPSQSASTEPERLDSSASAASTAASASASESRRPKPKKRRIPRDQVS